MTRIQRLRAESGTKTTMNIRTKMVSLLALLFVALIVLDVVVQNRILLPSFAELERDDAQTSMKRIGYALDQTLDGLQLSATDWGDWQDVYGYVQTPNADFVSANITPNAIKQLQVNALLIVDLQGKVVASRSQEMSGAELDLDVTQWHSLPENFPWRRNLAAGAPAKGLI